jgi:hypothetical protein
MAQRPHRLTHRLVLGCALTLLGLIAHADDGCQTRASEACYQSMQMPDGAGRVHYYASRGPDAPNAPAATNAAAAPTHALVVLHGHPRDAGKTFNAALQAVHGGGASADTLVVAPLFQVATADATRCRTPGMPQAQSGDLLWTCSSWLAGGAARNSAPATTSFAVLDALVAHLAQQWPQLRVVTLAGFSAGAQMVQHYIGFARATEAGMPARRYVVASPGTWLYFDAVRPQPLRAGQPADWASCANASGPLGDCTLALAAPSAQCPTANRWKYGTDALPATWGRSAAQARAQYAAADISYLAGALDSSEGHGTAYRVLDRSCAASVQGPFRWQRARGYLQYDNEMLAPHAQRTLHTVPGCAHSVACVFPAEAARRALLGPR